MSTIVQVPVNTMLADLDESLKTLLKRDLDRHGFDGVEIEFDAPDKEWAASLSSPAVNLFLYDIREAKELRPIDWEERMRDGRTFDLRPPLRIDASYAVTAWTRDVQDEHRLLSQVMAALYAFPTLPEEVLTAVARERLAALSAEDAHRAGAPRGCLGLLDRRRRPVQGLVQLRRDAVLRARRLARARPGGADGDDAALRPRLARGDAARDAPQRRHRRRRRRDGRPERVGAPPGDRPARGHRRRRPLPLRPAQARQLHRRRPRPRRQGDESEAAVPGQGAELALGAAKAAAKST